jgi:hypothetical protein
LLHRPGLLDPVTHITTEWREIAHAGYPAVLKRSLPVCWDCQVAETFRRMYPQLVIDAGTWTGKRAS